MKTVLPIFALILAIACSASSSHATTWYIKHDGSGDVPTIKEGIVMADSGDTVLLENGIYTGDGNRDIDFLGKSVVVRSRSNNPQYCIIDCQATKFTPHRGFVFRGGEDSTSVIQGVTIRNGYAPADTVAARVWNEEQALVRLIEKARNSYVRERWREMLVKLRSDRDPPADQGKLIVDSEIIRNGGAILCDVDSTGLGASPTIWNCRFINNTAELGGGIYVMMGRPSVVRCEFVVNTADEGGGLYVREGAVELSRCIFSDNTGSGVHAFYCAGLGAVACLFQNNEPTGLTYHWGYSGSVDRCAFSGNTLCGVNVEVSDLTATGCVFNGNGEYGIDGWQSGIDLVDCEIAGNEWIGVVADESGASLEDCVISENGSGVFVYGWGHMENCEFSRNENDGWPAGGLNVGGLHVDVVLDRCVFEENTGTHGGAIFLGGYGNSIAADSCTFVRNVSVSGACVHSEGSYPSSDTASVDLSNCIFFDNTAQDGGVVYIVDRDSSSASRLAITNSTLHGNAADRGGGIFYEGLVNVELDNSIIAFNNEGEAVYCPDTNGASPSVDCCDIYGNADGNWVGCIADLNGPTSTNIELNPLFCDPASGDFGVDVTSPCLPGHVDNPCSLLIGASADTCNLTAVTATGSNPPPVIRLFDARPNPFNPSTTIDFSLPKRQEVNLTIYDVQGRRVSVLVNGTLNKGLREVVWGGTDQRGNPVSSGVYFYRLTAGNIAITKKMVLLK